MTQIKSIKGIAGKLPTPKEYCHRTIKWCNKNKVKYAGDYLISPVYENAVLSTELSVNECACIDVEKVQKIYTDYISLTSEAFLDKYGELLLAKAIATSKDCLKWREE